MGWGGGRNCFQTYQGANGIGILWVYKTRLTINSWDGGKRMANTEMESNTRKNKTQQQKKAISGCWDLCKSDEQNNEILREIGASCHLWGGFYCM